MSDIKCRVNPLKTISVSCKWITPIAMVAMFVSQQAELRFPSDQTPHQNDMSITTHCWNSILLRIFRPFPSSHSDRARLCEIAFISMLSGVWMQIYKAFRYESGQEIERWTIFLSVCYLVTYLLTYSLSYSVQSSVWSVSRMSASKYQRKRLNGNPSRRQYYRTYF